MSEYEIEDQDVSCPYCGMVFDGMKAEDQLSEHLEKSKECKRKFKAQLEKLSETVKKKENQDRIEILKEKLRKKILLDLSKTHPRIISQIKANPEILEDRVNRELFGIALKTSHKVESLTPLVKKIQTSRFEELYHQINEQKICPSCGEHLATIQEKDPEVTSIIAHLHKSEDPNHKSVFEEYANSGKSEKDYQKWVAEQYPKKKKYEGKPQDELSKELEELSEEDLDRLLVKMLKKTMKRNR